MNPQPDDRKAFICELIQKWYECAPYGEQVPAELPRLFVEFCTRYGGFDEEAMDRAFSEAEYDDPMLTLFECIFRDAADFTIRRIADAVYDGNAEALKLVDLRPEGEFFKRTA